MGVRGDLAQGCIQVDRTLYGVNPETLQPLIRPVPSSQFLFTVSHLRDDIASEAYEDEMDMGRSGSYLNSSITSAWSEHSLDPEDIRVTPPSHSCPPPRIP